MPRKLKPIGDVEGTGKRHPFNMRTTHEMRKRLEDARLKSGRSLAAEIEYRLEQSFLHEDVKETIRQELLLAIPRQIIEPAPLEAYRQSQLGRYT